MITPAMISPYSSKNSNLIHESPISPSQANNIIVLMVATAKHTFTKIIAIVPYWTAANVKGNKAIQGVNPRMATRPHPAFLSLSEPFNLS